MEIKRMEKKFDELKKSKEESYFERKNREAMERIANKKVEEKPRLSPITGEPMERVVVHGVVIDRCNTSGGIWLDAGELEQLVNASKAADADKHGEWLWGFLRSIGHK